MDYMPFLKHDTWHLYTLDSRPNVRLASTPCIGFQLILEYHYASFTMIQIFRHKHCYYIKIKGCKHLP